MSMVDIFVKTGTYSLLQRFKRDGLTRLNVRVIALLDPFRNVLVFGFNLSAVSGNIVQGVLNLG